MAASVSERWIYLMFLWLHLVLICQKTISESATTTAPGTTLPTTVPLPPGACMAEDGRVYNDGDVITTDSNGCGGTMCSWGDIVWFDKWCLFYSSTTSTTSSPTTVPPDFTTPGIPQGWCNYDGNWYEDGEDINLCPNNCCGLRCDHGDVYAWDSECAPAIGGPPPCAGWQEYIPGECCPICHTTTLPPTTTPHGPPGGCFYDGVRYNHDDIFYLDPNGCHGYECHYGIIRPWTSCLVTEENCEGTLVNVTGECCPVCQDSVGDRTTLPANGTQEVCIIRGETYTLGMLTNNDVCNKCYCTPQGEACQKTTCDDVSDCVNTYRPKGECCFMCSAAESFTCNVHIYVLLLVGVISIWRSQV